MRPKHLLIFALIAITACSKKDNIPDTDITAAQDDANATFVINDTKNIADGAAQNQIGVISNCATVTKRDTIIQSKTDSLIDINFGTTPCACNDGRNRQGHLFVFWYHAHSYFTTGDTIDMTFGNYFMNTKGISGRRTLVNIGADSATNMSWNFTASLSITYLDGQTAIWSATRTNHLAEVSGAWYYIITGNGTGVSKNAVSYSHTITSALYYSAVRPWNGGCPYPEQGAITIARNNNSHGMLLTYVSGLGNCPVAGAVYATATIESNIYALNLP